MPENIVHFVTQYGYLAIFILIFLQEVGFPNLFPNELLLMFSGYLSFTKILYLPFVILTAMIADFISANILYFTFLKAGSFILDKKPGWIPLSAKMLSRLSEKISKGGNVNIFIFRVTPFTRGYTSVISGLIHIKPVIYLPIVIGSGISWASFWVLTGHLIGPSWNFFSQNDGKFKLFMLIMLLTSVLAVVLIYFLRKRKTDRENKSGGTPDISGTQ